MIGEGISGWCIKYDSAGVPDLEECMVRHGGADEFFIREACDRHGNNITVCTLQVGKSFFYTKEFALAELAQQLEATQRGYMELERFVARRLDYVLKEMKEKGDAPS